MKIRQTKITRSAKGQRCTVRIVPCSPPETVVFAHIQRPGFGKVGGKACDLHGAYACANCHDVLDRRGSAWKLISPGLIIERKLAGMQETQEILVERGLVVLA